MFWSKSHSAKGKKVVAICDENLLEKKIGKDRKVLVKKSFYGGKLINEKEASELMKNSNVCNLLGKDTIELALRNKFITEENVMFIGDVPHAQFIQ